ncbi:MAG: PIN domain-containing protein [Candidatus Woesearchaeota archaeon]
MKLVVDTNVLFTYFWESSLLRTVLKTEKLVLLAPEYALVELNKHKELITKKTGITSRKFRVMLAELAETVEFVPLEEYSGFLKKAIKITPDEDDVDFFALALKEECALWTNDKGLEQQNFVLVYSTKDIVGSTLM